ncbi:protein kinase, partial [Moorena sp. SIO4G3]|uniref:protein kinase domain-containing protein n=1 Tax=Moorena sp. SIO4G3 TaxID=2607821 RepID=UPI00142AE0D1
MLGKLLDGRYQVTQVLGSGGFGKTYLAKDTKRPGNPSCVVKQLMPPNGSQTFLDTARRLFSREAETLEKLGNHDQIPRLLAYFEEDHEFYLVQQFIEGHLLSQELSPGHRWQENLVIGLLQEVLSILEFVHRHGVIHRDIKPDNLIRRTADRKLVLVDFGAVKQVQTDLASAYRQTHHTVVVGTPGYMSSEQALGQPCPSSDIYALGIIGIQALTGMVPDQFHEDLNTGEVNWQSLVSASVGLSVGLANVLTKMVRYQVKDRYQSASQVLQDLQQLSANSKAYSINSPTYYSIHNVPTVEENFPPEPVSKLFSEQKTWDANAHRGSTPNKPAATPLPPTKVDRSDNLSLIIGTGIALVTSSIAGMIYSVRSSSWSPPRIAQPIPPRSTPNRRSAPVVYEPPAPAAPGNCQVTGLSVNVRSEPNGSKVDQLNQGSSLVLTGSGQPGWVEISSPVTGWVFTNLTDCAPTVEPVVATAPKRNVPKRNVPRKRVYAQPKPVVKRAPSSPQTPQPTPAPPVVDNGSLILARAVQKYQAGNIKGAIAIAQDVLPSSAAFNGAQTKIDQWHNEWVSFERKFDQIQQAYEQGRWVDVLNYAKNSNLPPRGYWRQKLNRIMAEARQQQAKVEAKRKQFAVQNQIGSRAKQEIQNNSQPASRPVSIAAPLPKQPVVTGQRTTAPPPSKSTKIKYYVILNDGSSSGLANARKIVPGAFLGRFPQGSRIQMGAF